MTLARVLVVLLVASGVARAQPSKDPNVRAHLDSAKKHFDLQEYAAAADELKAAYLITADPQLLYGIGQAQRMNGDCEHAILSYRSFLRSKPKPDQTKLAEDNIKRCQEIELQRRDAAAAKADAAHAEAARAEAARAAAQADLARAELARRQAPRTGGEARPSWGGRILVGTGAIATGAGITLAVIGQHRISAVNDAAFYDDYVAASKSAASAKTLRTVGLVTTGAGVALLVAGVIVLVSHGDDTGLGTIEQARRRGARPQLAIGPRGELGVAWTW